MGIGLSPGCFTLTQLTTNALGNTGEMFQALVPREEQDGVPPGTSLAKIKPLWPFGE